MRTVVGQLVVMNVFVSQRLCVGGWGGCDWFCCKQPWHSEEGSKPAVTGVLRL